MKQISLLALATLLAITSCKKKNSSSTNIHVPDVYKKIYGATDMYVDGNFVVIKTNGRPDHKSPYYQGTQWENTLYVNDTRSSFTINPNRISTHNYTFKIPLNPASAASKTQTPMGPMGVAINGVSIFNQYAAGRAALTGEIFSFDLYGGHPAQQGDYHYHVEPVYLTGTKGSSALMGFLLDGFPVYGPMENGSTVTNSNLDVYHGHTSATADYPNGIYHYHITSADPYINGNAFYGTPGTVSQ